MVLCYWLVIKSWGPERLCYLYTFTWNDLDLRHEKESYFALAITVVIVVFYNFYSRIILYAVDFWNCVKLDDSDIYYLEIYPSILCWEEKHYQFLYLISFTNILFWGLLCPFGIFIFSYKLRASSRNSINNYNPYQKILKYLTYDFKEKYYIWDLFTYFSKLFIVFLTVLIKNLETSSQGAVLILVFLSLFLIQEHLKPYKQGFINDIKTASLVTTISSFAFSITASSKGVTNTQQLIFLILSMGFALFFYISWSLAFIKAKSPSFPFLRAMGKRKWILFREKYILLKKSTKKNWFFIMYFIGC